MGYASHLAAKAVDRAVTAETAFVGDSPRDMILKQRDSDSARSGLGLYWVQLALNGLWAPLFFGLRQVRLLLE